MPGWISAHVHAAVDIDDGACDESGGIRGEKRRQGGNLFRLAQSANRDRCVDGLHLFFSEIFDDVGVSRSRSDGVNSDSTSGDLFR